jgi:SAM-dependent methyltransferase
MLGHDRPYVPQRSIYDERYLADGYDHRSAVRVLTAEKDALDEAVGRALKSNPQARTISIFDFGYGTGRVTNEFIEHFIALFGAWRKDLLVVAYDVSSGGLKKAQAALCAKGFKNLGEFSWHPGCMAGYIAGSVSKAVSGVSITVRFVHASEDQPPENMTQLALRANDGQGFLVTTSWYSGLGHVPGEALRREYFRQLGELTVPSGEIVLSLSSTGDLVDEQREWVARLAAGAVDDFPIEAFGDVVYRTELDQRNFYHVFGTELGDHMAAITGPGQYWWTEGIRCPDEEFASEAEEQANYLRVRNANEAKRGRIWEAADYREFHTVAALRSPMDPMKR